MKSNAEVSINNIYRLDGRVPLGKAIPFGLQHVLAMFVANLTPIVIVTAAAGLEIYTAQVFLTFVLIIIFRLML